MNWHIQGEFIPFERGRADYNIVTGTLGLISTVEGVDLLAVAGVGEGESVMGWALREIIRNPVRYALRRHDMVARRIYL